jgi:crotonobetainyl-CoA:carnitine CoA-transferase CaiB-like acyl-CoA transferase
VTSAPALHRLWTALGGDPACGEDLEVRHAGRHLPSRFAVDELAVGAVGAMLLAAAELADARGLPRPRAAVDARHVAVAFTSERHLQRDGRTPASTFAPLSRFLPTRDGWIRLHANYPHHRAALLRALGTDEAGVPAVLAAAEAQAAEDAIHAVGGAAAAVRTEAAWRDHPQGRAVAGLPLVARAAGAHAPWPALGGPSPAPHRPAAGLRVVDLTRVIAGPVATRVLAALGADVIRVDPPHLPEVPGALDDTAPGKRLVDLDLRRDDDARRLDALLAGAHVLVAGYRPGALDALGLGPAACAARHPHLVVASLSAWGETGPWAARRGFDSLVQAATGIALAEGRDGAPGVLPAQALDHATGYLLAAAVLRASATRARGGPAGTTRLALAATAAALQELERTAGDDAAAAADPEDFRIALDDPAVRIVAPPGTLDGRPPAWAHGPRRIAPAAARW